MAKPVSPTQAAREGRSLLRIRTRMPPALRSASSQSFRSDSIGTKALACCFDAFSSREPVPTSLENALMRWRTLDLNLLPGLVGVERPHAPGNALGPLAQVLLVDRAGMIDHERHHARIAVLGRVGDERKTTDHLATHDIVQRTARRIRSLLRQDP